MHVWLKRLNHARLQQNNLLYRFGPVAELVDALDSKSSSARSVGSSPTRATRNKAPILGVFLFLYRNRQITIINIAVMKNEILWTD